MNKDKLKIRYVILGLACVVGVGLWLQSRTDCVGRDTGLGDACKGVNTEDALPSPIGVYRVTAYCPCEKCCGKWADGITACGHKIYPGDKFAAAPPEFPFGTVLEIAGYGKVEVLDRGGAIKGKRLDVYFDSHQQALTWGVKYIEVFEL